MEETKHDASDLEANASSSPSFANEDRNVTTTGDADELSRIPTHLDWNSPTDPENPRTWSFGKRAFHTAVPALYGFFLTVGAATYVPAIPYVQREFDVSRTIALLPLSFYTFGFVIGPIFTAPMSELYGRRIVYWVSLPWWLIFTAASGVSHNITVFTIVRLLAGTGGSGALVVGAGTIADIWDMDAEGGKAALGFVCAPFLGSTLGPLAGAYVIAQYDNDWRWSMWVLLCIAAPVAVMAVFLSETSKSRILYLRQKKAGLVSKGQSGDVKILLRKMRKAVTIPVHMMLIEPLVSLLSIYTGFSFAMVFAFFGSFNYVFQSVYHFNQKEVGLTFIGIIVGYAFGVAVFGFFDGRVFQPAVAKAKERGERPAPELRLFSSMLGSICLPIGLFWFAWAPQKDVHWIVPVLAGLPFGVGGLTVFLSATTYLVDVYGVELGSSAVAANGILRFTFGAVFPLFTIQMYEALGVHWAGSVFAFASLALMPVPWVFFKWGAVLRSRSLYAKTERNIGD